MPRIAEISPSTPASPRLGHPPVVSAMAAARTSDTHLPSHHPRAGPSQHRTRFEPSRWSTAWDKFKKHLRPASHPSTTSESAIDSSFATTDHFFLDSDNVPHGYHPSLDLLNPLAGTSSRFKKRSDAARKRSGKSKSSVANSNSRFGDDDYQNLTQPVEPVSHVVVDVDFEHFTPHAARSDGKSDGGSTGHTPAASAARHSGLGLFSKSASNGGVSGGGGGGGRGSGAGDEDGDGEGNNTGAKDRTEAGSVRRDRRPSWIQRSAPYAFVTERMWPNMAHFLDSSFPEEVKERAFQKESWFMNKQGALASSAYFVIAWILTVSLLPMPLTPFNWGTYVGAAAFFTVPVVFMVIFDYPRLHNKLYQPFLFGATWIFADIIIIEMNVCGFFSFDNQCGSRNFLNMFGFAFGQPVLALMALRQNRVWAIAGAAQWLILVGALLMTEDNYPTLFYRNVITFAFFHAFIIGTAFLKERSDRQMFALRQQLKIQYRATQSAQVEERRASDSKKRFVSYIFHEVRVPLNTALLAVQNLVGEQVFKGLQEDQAEMVDGLMGSLTMMEKVLNDVLSFNRMESGKFAQARKPFEFHKSIQIVALSHRMQAQMAGIELIVDLDSAIDKIGGVFVGDEMRLRQVTSNLVSNSIKFTDSGSVRIVTKLLYPRVEPTPSSEIDDPLKIAAENAQAQIQHLERGNGGGDAEKLGYADLEKGSIALETRRQSRESSREKEQREKEPVRKAVIRVEIHDTGVGLRKQDVIENRLFSPYVQTEIGRRQGGKGSGLGLALVRQIVKLSNGRLGVESEYGKGSMFWFELPYSLPSRRKDTLTPSQSLGFTLDHTPVAPSIAHFASPPASTPGPGLQPPPLDFSHSPAPTGLQQQPPPNLEEMQTNSSNSIESVLASSSQGTFTRPGLPVTESNLPLLPHAHRSTTTADNAARRYSELPLDEMVVNTFSPPLSLTPGVHSPVSPLESGVPPGVNGNGGRGSERDPFASAASDPLSHDYAFAAGAQPSRPIAERRSSDWSSNATKVDVTASPERAPAGRSDRQEPDEGTNAGAGAGAGTVPRPRIGLTLPSPSAAGHSGALQSPLSPGGPQGLMSPTLPVGDAEPPLCTLVVDDDKLTRMLMSRMLKRLGHQVTTAENGKVALEMIRGSYEGAPNIPKFDIVFLDNQMPLMSGVEVAHEVRSASYPIFIVGCTGNALREDQEEYLAAGADDILPKPIHQKAVLEMIKEARKRVRGETSWSPPKEGEVRERRGSQF